MNKTKSYVYGTWYESEDSGVEVRNPINGDVITHVSSQGVDFARVLAHGRDKGGSGLRELTLHERGNLLKELGKYLTARKEDLYAISALTGATRADGWVDIEGGAGTLFGYSGVARREFANEKFIVEGAPERLSARGTFVGQHILTPKRGVSVHINAFNFPCWGMLEKIAPSLIAGVPVVVKPATDTAYLTQAMVEMIVESGLLPEGAIQLICGRVGDLFEHLTEQDSVTFTGSASTGQMLRNHPVILAKSVPFNMEADSINCCVMGATVTPKEPEFDLFVKEVAREMTGKTGQKCTAIRRALVPAAQLEAVKIALSARLAKVVVGDPAEEGVRMGPLVSRSQRDSVRENVALLMKESDLVFGGEDTMKLTGGDAENGAFYPPTLLCARDPLNASHIHSVEAFGPVATLIAFNSKDEAVQLANMGRRQSGRLDLYP